MTCPHCGHCSHCGRHAYPYNPIWGQYMGSGFGQYVNNYNSALGIGGQANNPIQTTTGYVQVQGAGPDAPDSGGGGGCNHG